jgi:LDH2 family malate/lactate/ureidoglycolate dehydrogenase
MCCAPPRRSTRRDPVLVPGDPETAARAERLRDGIPLTGALVEKLRGVCERSGVPFLLG